MKKKYSVALMVDQRLGSLEDIPFSINQLITTLPAQLALKFNCEIIPIYLERDKNNFKMEIQNLLKLKTGNIENDKDTITSKLIKQSKKWY